MGTFRPFPPIISLFCAIIVLTVLFSGCITCEKSCQGQCYNPVNESCCKGQLYPGRWSPCGDACYETATQVCYRGSIYNGTYWSVLGTWEAESDPDVTMTFLPSGSVIVDPFPRCNRTLKSIGNWTCNSSRLFNGTWSWDFSDERYTLVFTFSEAWEGFDMNPTYVLGDPVTAYDRDRADRWKTNPPAMIWKEVNDTVIFQSGRGTAASRVLRLHVASPPKDQIFDYFLGYGYLFSYSMNWTANDYGTWKRPPDETPSGYIPAEPPSPDIAYMSTTHESTPQSGLIPVVTTTVPGTPGDTISSPGEGLVVPDYIVHFYTNGTLIEDYTYQVNTTSPINMLSRFWDMPLTISEINIPHIRFVSMTAPPGTAGYVKDNDGTVTLFNHDPDEAMEQAISAHAGRNETGIYKADYFSPGTYTVRYVFDLHPKIRYDNTHVLLPLVLSRDHVPYKNITIVMPATHVLNVTSSSLTMTIAQDPSGYMITGTSERDQILGMDIILSPDIRYELDGFYFSVDKVTGT